MKGNNEYKGKSIRDKLNTHSFGSLTSIFKDNAKFPFRHSNWKTQLQHIDIPVLKYVEIKVYHSCTQTPALSRTHYCYYFNMLIYYWEDSKELVSCIKCSIYISPTNQTITNLIPVPMVMHFISINWSSTGACSVSNTYYSQRSSIFQNSLYFLLCYKLSKQQVKSHQFVTNFTEFDIYCVRRNLSGCM